MDEIEIAERPELPEVPAELEEPWALMAERCKSERHMIGLRYWLGGYSWRESARLAGLRDQSQLVDTAKRYGILEAATRTDRLIQSKREIAHEADQEILRRFRENEIRDDSLRDVAVVSGIATDKIRDREGWSRQQEAKGAFSSVFGDALTSLAQSGGGSLSVTLEVEPATDPVAAAVTVDAVAESVAVAAEGEPDAISGASAPARARHRARHTHR